MNELIDFSLDTENAKKNYDLAKWYECKGHTAPAHTYYLRAAERSEDCNFSYQALIRASFCYKSQGSRDETEKILLQNALTLMPKRPEAYYFLSLLYEKKEEWQNCYIYSHIGLECSDDNVEVIDISEYTGNHLLIFQKAVSSWHWGKGKESRNLFANLINEYWDIFDKKHKNLIKNNVYKLKFEDEIKILENKYCIPVIGVPIVNGVHWLKRLIESVDYPVKDFFIINNSADEEITNEINELKDINHPFIEKILICNLPSNLGVSASWNLIIKSYMMAPYWIICSNDVAFTPGFLKEMVDKSKDDETGIVQPNGHHGLGSYEVLLLKDFVIEKCGLFDENLYPAYTEDIDYILKIKKHNIKKQFLETPFYHGETQDYSASGSQTWRLNSKLREKIDNAHFLNKYQYLTKKWGENYEQELYNENHIPIENYMNYDLKFNKQKYLGF